MHRIRRFGILSMAKIQGVLLLLFGLLFGLLYGIVLAIVGIVAAVSGEKEGAILIVAGVGCMIGFPVLYGGMGFVMGALMAWFYNLIAGRIGGLEVDLELAPDARPEP